MAASQFKLDARKFNQTIEQYRKFSRRDEVEIVNTKAFYIARRAVVETIKADKNSSKNFPMQTWFDRSTQEAIGRIINKRRGKRGEPGLYGKAMRDAQLTMKAARLRSIGFIKSGWIWAIKNLEPYVKSKRGAARSEAGSIKTVGQPKGKGIPSNGGAFFIKAIIKNFAVAFHTTRKDPLGEFGSPALQRAVDFETASMKKYIEDKLRKSAQDAGIKTN